MKILHYIPQDDDMITSYVTMLIDNMGLEAENVIATEEAVAKEKLKSIHFDILHIHGCWRNSSAKITIFYYMFNKNKGYYGRINERTNQISK